MSQRLRYPELAPDGVAAMTALEHHLNVSSGLEPVLLALVRLHASMLNGCDYCVSLHAAELGKHHEPASRLGAVMNWQHSEAFTERERAALRWSEAITNIQASHAADDQFAAVRKHFTDAEVVNLTLAIASINAWNRMAIAFRPEWRDHGGSHTETQAEEPNAPGDDGGKVAVDA